MKYEARRLVGLGGRGRSVCIHGKSSHSCGAARKDHLGEVHH